MHKVNAWEKHTQKKQLPFINKNFYLGEAEKKVVFLQKCNGNFFLVYDITWTSTLQVQKQAPWQDWDKLEINKHHMNKELKLKVGSLELRQGGSSVTLTLIGNDANAMAATEISW